MQPKDLYTFVHVPGKFQIPVGDPQKTHFLVDKIKMTLVDDLDDL